MGSASATGSVGGGTTWASGSDLNETDKMSEDQDDGVSRASIQSDDGSASLVGFGEGASSTISGPVSTSSRMLNRQSSLGSPGLARGGSQLPFVQQQGGGMQGIRLPRHP